MLYVWSVSDSSAVMVFMPRCEISGLQFSISEAEARLRKQLGLVKTPTTSRAMRLRSLAAFWPHFSLSKTRCGYSGRQIVAVFDDACPYPVWHRSDWTEHANPPTSSFDFQRPAFEQAWDLFQQCPIPHNFGHGNENCEYADDIWYSKSCYLSHSIYKCEDLLSCFRQLTSRNCAFSVYSLDCELCSDTVHSINCYRLHFGIRCRSCNDCTFLFDCRGCSDCFLCWNLRNKRYCIRNQQYSKADYERERAKYDLSSRRTFDTLKAKFLELLETLAVFPASQLDHCEASNGDYLVQCNRCEDCFYCDQTEDCINTIRGGFIRSCLDCVGPAINAERCHNSCLPVDTVYDVGFSFGISHSSYLEYCGFCEKCVHCFLCWGLREKQFCILNKQYSESDYHRRKAEIVRHMMATEEYENLFPSYFSPVAYDSSLAGIYFPLNEEAQNAAGFRTSPISEMLRSGFADGAVIPDCSKGVSKELCGEVFWDAVAMRPFRLSEHELLFFEQNGLPLPNTFYVRRLKENFSWIPFAGSLRTTACAHCKNEVQTTWPVERDGRIACKECYLQQVA